MGRTQTPYLMLGLLLLVGLVLRGAIALYLHPGFDEAYYYLYTRHLSLSYFDHPPLVAFTTGFGVWLTGQVSQFTIRLGPLLLYTGTLIFLYLTGQRLFNAKTGLLTVAIATVIPIFQVGFGIMTLPDSPLMFFWSACLYVCACEFFRDSVTYRPSYRLSIISALVGLACLGKYHGFVLGFGLVCFCLLSDRHRRAFRSPWLALGVLLFALILSPVLVWNAQHDWVSFTFQSSRAVSSQPYRWVQAGVTALLTVAYLFPTMGIPLWWAIAHDGSAVLGQMFSWKDNPNLWRKRLLIGCVSVPLIFGFIYVGGYQQVLPTWQMPGFFSACLLLGYWGDRWQQRRPAMVRNWLIGTGVTVAVLLGIATAHVSAGVLQADTDAGWGGFIPVETDASTQLIDIRQLRSGFAQSPDLSQALKTADFVFVNQIFIAGQTAMAIAPLTSAPVTCFGSDLRGFAYWSDPTDWVGKTGLYVTSATFENEVDPAHPFQDYFQSFSSLGQIPIVRSDTVIEIFKVFLGETLLKPYPRSA